MLGEINNEQIVYINTDMMESPFEGEDLFDTRRIAYQNLKDKSAPKITIAVTAYNRLEKTKRCVEYILKYTRDFNYNLLLVDNGSTDGTFGYYKSVPYENKTIWKVSKNIGLNYAFSLILRYFSTEYVIVVSNDTYVTKNWLRNMMVCFESDARIGLICPVSSNISNLQEVDLQVKDFSDMQRKAAEFNRSDPRKWQERMRIITIILATKREVCDSAGIVDLGFYHDFGDDDISARIRHAGYKLMLCGDTYIYHDHDFRNLEDKDPEQFQKSIERGRQNYVEKYQGIDAWDDINNFELGMTQVLDSRTDYPEKPDFLCIDPRCGTPVLQIRNVLRTKGIMQSNSHAFTSKAKYFYDLQLVTDGQTVCDRIDFIPEYYLEESFDIVMLCDPVNTYADPLGLTQNLLRTVKKGGKLVLKLRNPNGLPVFFNMLDIQKSQDADMTRQISQTRFDEYLNTLGITGVFKANFLYDIPQNITDTLIRGLQTSGICGDATRAIQEMSVMEYVYLIVK